MSRDSKSNMMNDGSICAIETKACPVCGEIFETGNLLLTERLDKPFKDKLVCTGYELCPAHKKQIDDGYIIVIELADGEDPELNEYGNIDDNGYRRSGLVASIRKAVFQEIFDHQLPKHGIAFCKYGVIDMLKQMTHNTEGEEQE